MTAVVSAIVVCSSVPHQARSFLRHLAEVERPERIELALVSRNENDYRRDADGFAAVHRIAMERTDALNDARARAVEVCGTPIVVFLEDHVRFEGPFVDALLDVFASERAAAVGWIVEPGRLEPSVALAGWMVEYGGWGPAAPTGPSALLPGHNCAYRRDVLLAFSDELPSLLRAENILHTRLAQSGERLELTPRIRMRHHQFLSLARFLHAGFWYGWNFADARQASARWGAGRRVLQALGAPAVPLLRWIRLARVVRRERMGLGATLRCAPAATLSFVSATAGETLGHLFGVSHGVLLRLTEVEMDYDRFIP